MCRIGSLTSMTCPKGMPPRPPSLGTEDECTSPPAVLRPRECSDADDEERYSRDEPLPHGEANGLWAEFCATVLRPKSLEGEVVANLEATSLARDAGMGLVEEKVVAQ